MIEKLPQLPQEFYIAIGILVLANLSVVLTVLTFIFKAGKFVATTEAGIVSAQETANRAHKRIDTITKS